MNAKTQLINTKQGVIVKIGEWDTDAAFRARIRRAEKKVGAKLTAVRPTDWSILSTRAGRPRWSFNRWELRVFNATRALQSRAGKLLFKLAGEPRQAFQSPGWIENAIQAGRVPRVLARMTVNPTASVINFITPKLP